MSETPKIPDDILKTAWRVYDELGRGQTTDERKIARAIMAERERAETKSAQAYQVIGSLLDLVGLFESDEGRRALDYFSMDAVDEEFLPWPNIAAIREARS